ncbi:MAG TPA: outer membrane beta-barrel protein [Terriglobales bacterium]|jgi:opacity protein-like surface antigen|nr:outer membrane beta-barrel protein [Terriglobales bacterium]
MQKVTRKLGIVFLLSFLPSMMASAAWAQIPTRGNVFFGYSYDRTSISSGDTSNLNGWEATLEGKFLPWIGLVADVDGHYGSHTYGSVCSLPCPNVNADIAAHNALFGPRVSVTIKRFRPFGEFLVGVAHISRSNGISDSDTSFANGAGGGLDYRVFGPVTVRAQLDWINTRFYGEGQNGVRFSTGVAVHF